MIEIKQFSLDAAGTVKGHIFIMSKSCFVWIGSGDVPPEFSNLTVAMPTKYDNLPLSTTLLSEGGGENDDYSSVLSQRISKTFGIQCFVSCCASRQVQASVHAVEKMIVQEIRPHFTWFLNTLLKNHILSLFETGSKTTSFLCSRYVVRYENVATEITVKTIE